MKKIEILGPGCTRCKKLFDMTQSIVLELGIPAEVTKVTDIDKITGYGVMMTPALVIDGKVMLSGKVPSPDEIKGLILK